MNRKAALKRLDSLEALAEAVLRETTEIRKELGVGSPSSPRRETHSKAVAKVLTNRKKALKRKSF